MKLEIGSHEVRSKKSEVMKLEVGSHEVTSRMSCFISKSLVYIHNRTEQNTSTKNNGMVMVVTMFIM